MSRIICLLLMSCLISCSVSDSLGKGEVQSESFYSPALGNYWDYNVYYPAGYDTSKEYPVIYLLHGAYGDYTQWNNENYIYGGGKAQSTLDRVIADGKLPPTIVIMPDGRNSWYTNVQGTDEYAGLHMLSAFENDLFRHVEEMYPVTNSRTHRAIMGNSMGGHGAIGIGMRNPGYFGTVAALSPAITTKYITEQYIPDTVKAWAERDFYYLFGNPFEIAKWTAVSYENIYDDFAAEKSTYPVRFYITIGSKDEEALPTCSAYLAGKLEASGIEYVYKPVEGEAHTFSFWNSVLGYALEYIGKDFLK